MLSKDTLFTNSFLFQTYSISRDGSRSAGHGGCYDKTLAFSETDAERLWLDSHPFR